jgi:serpin B
MRCVASLTLFIAACLAPAAANAAPASGPPAVAAAYNATGSGLMRSFAARPGNIVFSPVSIGLAMSMAAHGARGATRDEMLHALSIADDGAAAAALLGIINGYDRSASPAARVAIANALMIVRGDVLPDYASDLKRDYGAEVFRTAGLATVNDWVKDRTHGGVGKILDQLSPNDVAVILNAAWFKAGWADSFDRKATHQAPFHLTPQTSVPVETMHHGGMFDFVAGDGFRAVNLRYTLQNLRMMIVVPDAVDGADAVSARLDAAAFEKLRADLYRTGTRRVDLFLPRFKLRYDAGSLVASFQALGMKLAFDQAAADFSGIGPDLHISDIVHHAAIEATEEGTEASAATAVVISGRSISSQRNEPEVLRVDRPFLFYVTDEATGAILFQGRVSDPRGS